MHESSIGKGVAMGNSQERVWKDRTLKGPRKTIMAYLVYRANDDGLCWPGMVTIQTECGISPGARKKHMKALVDGGYITYCKAGDGRGNTTCIRVNDHYIKGVEFVPLNDDKGGRICTPSHSERGSDMDPFNEERGSNLTERGSNLNVEEQEEHSNNNYYADPILELVSEFEALTTLSPPHPKVAAYHSKWESPLSKFLELCNGDIPAAVVLMRDAVQALRSNGNGKRYTIASPKSLETAVSNLVSQRSVTLPAGPDHGAIFDQHFSVMASRSRSLRGIVSADYIRVVNQIGRGEFQNCSESNKPFLRKRFIQAAQEQLQVMA